MKKMVRVLLMLLIAILMFSVSAHAKKFLTVSTGGTAGAFYGIGTLFGSAFNKTLADTGYKWSVQSSGGSIENLEMLRAKETDIILAGCAPTSYSFEGVKTFDGKPNKDLRFITALWPEYIQFVVRKDSGINKWADLRGKRIGMGPPGGGGSFYGPMVLKALANLTFDNLQPEFISYGDAVQALQNNLIAGYYGSGAIPNSNILQSFSGRVPVMIMEMPADSIGPLQKEGSFFYLAKIPAGTYTGQDKDILTAAMKSALVTRVETDPKIVEQMLETLYIKEFTNLQKMHNALKILTMGTALEGLSSAPLHKGAVVFYQKQGIKVPKALIPPEM